MPILGADGHGGWSYKFVDGIAASPTVRLDLHSGTVRVTKGVDFGNAPIRRASSSTLLVDGDRIGASAYGNRTLRLPIHISASTPESFRADVEVLFRELSRERNTLMVQTSDRPVFFRTYRASDAVLRRIGAAHADTILEIELVAEPFAYGLKETLPAMDHTLANRMVVTVPGSSIKGDVPTPAYLTLNPGEAAQTLLVGSRPGVMSHETLAPADAATWTGGTSTVTNGDTFEGGSRKTISDLTAVGDTTTSGNFPGVVLRSGQTDRRALNGRYRAFLKIEATLDAADRYLVELRQGTTDTFYSGVTRVLGKGEIKGGTDPLIGAAYCLVDLGVVQVPFGRVSTSIGLDGQLAAADLSLSLKVTRLHATGVGGSQVVVDALMMFPADDALMIATVDAASTTSQTQSFTFDPNGSVIVQDVATGRLVSEETVASYIGTPPMLHPGVDTHVVASLVTPSTYGVGPLSAAYWPRYLTVA